LNTYSKPSISTITAPYNSAKIIRHSIESIFFQIYTVYEDNGIYSNLCYVLSNDLKKIIKNCVRKPFIAASLKYEWVPTHVSLFFKKSVYEKQKDFNLPFRVSSDYDFIVSIFKANNLSFKYTPHFITNIKLGGNSNRDLKNIIIKLKEDYAIIRKNEIGCFFTLLLMVLMNFSKISQFF